MTDMATASFHKETDMATASFHKETDVVAASLNKEMDGGLEIPPAECPARVPEKEPGRTQRLRQHFAAEITTNHADILLLTCCFISGLVDSTVYNAYGTFVSMQTGALNLFLCLPSCE